MASLMKRLFLYFGRLSLNNAKIEGKQSEATSIIEYYAL